MASLLKRVNRIKSTLRYRIVLAIFLLQSLVMGGVLWQTTSHSHQNIKDFTDKNEQLMLDFMADLSTTALFTTSYDEIQQYVDRMAQEFHTRKILIVNNTGTVVVASDYREVGRKHEKFSDSSQLYWKTKDISGIGRVAIQFSSSETDSARRRMVGLGAGIAVTGMLIIAVGGNLFGFLLTRKLATLTDAAERFAHGDMQARTGFGGDDEVALLGQAFDKMTERIEKTIEELEKSKIELAAARDDLEIRVEERTQELKEANAKLQQLSATDGLTGIANRRRFDEMLVSELKRARRNQTELSLLMIDVDFFKQFNDTYGHQAGDECLVSIATTIGLVASRSTDIAARYGGEEFAVILPDTNREGALKVAERVCQHVLAMKIPHEKSLAAPYVTVSVGLATCADCASENVAATLVEVADSALYLAKDGGRNRVVAACHPALD